MSAKAVATALAARLQAIDGTGDYVNDLSGADAVTRRSSVLPDRLPMLSVQLVSVQCRPGPDLTGFTHRAKFRLFGVCAVTDDTEATRADAAMDMLDDINRALRADRTLSNTVLDSSMEVDGETFMGQDEATAIEYAGAVVVVTVEYWEAQ